MQRWILPTNIGLTIVIIALLAKISSDLITFRLAKVFPGTGKKVVAMSRQPAVADDLSSFAPILEKGLFGKSTQGSLSPVVAARSDSPKAAPTVAEGDLILLGTALGSFRETFALILKKSSNEERVFRLGDSVFDMGSLAAVQKEGVAGALVNQPSDFKAIASGLRSLGQPTAAAAPTAGGGMASQVGAGSYVIDQRALNAALDNIGQAMTDARLLPSVKDGKVEGFRASEVKPNGIFGTIGIKNGDVLRAINDFPIDSPEKAIQSFAALKGMSRIKLDLVRDGQPTTFTYDIR